MRRIDEIILHCTATKEGVKVTRDQVDSWHKQRGWCGIGYHYLIGLDGSLMIGRPENQIGAHCRGHNENSIGVAYVGGLDKNGKPKDTRTPEQKRTLCDLMHGLHARFPNARLYGHNQFSEKACPSFKVQDDKQLCAIFSSK